MNKQNGDKITGYILLLGLVVVLMSLLGAFNAFEVREYSSAGILMLSASIPVAAAVHGVLNKK